MALIPFHIASGFIDPNVATESDIILTAAPNESISAEIPIMYCTLFLIKSTVIELFVSILNVSLLRSSCKALLVSLALCRASSPYFAAINCFNEIANKSKAIAPIRRAIAFNIPLITSKTLVNLSRSYPASCACISPYTAAPNIPPINSRTGISFQESPAAVETFLIALASRLIATERNCILNQRDNMFPIFIWLNISNAMRTARTAPIMEKN